MYCLHIILYVKLQDNLYFFIINFVWQLQCFQVTEMQLQGRREMMEYQQTSPISYHQGQFKDNSDIII